MEKNALQSTYTYCADVVIGGGVVGSAGVVGSDVVIGSGVVGSGVSG
jgi:hypothetical protein